MHTCTLCMSVQVRSTRLLGSRVSRTSTLSLLLGDGKARHLQCEHARHATRHEPGRSMPSLELVPAVGSESAGGVADIDVMDRPELGQQCRFSALERRSHGMSNAKEPCHSDLTCSRPSQMRKIFIVCGAPRLFLVSASRCETHYVFLFGKLLVGATSCIPLQCCSRFAPSFLLQLATALPRQKG